MSLKKQYLAGLCLCAVGAALGAETTHVSQPFANVTADLTSLISGTWSGDGSVTNQTAGYAYDNTVGMPIAAPTEGANLYLSVDGAVTCTAATTASKPATVDMMIQISRPEDALVVPDGENKDDIQIAVGVDKDGKFEAYCKGKTTAGDGTVSEAATAWNVISSGAYDEGSWHRVSFTFDYGNHTCQIRLDGEPLMSAFGYLTSDKQTATAQNGSWYALNLTTKTSLSSVKVVGSTAIDAVVVKSGDTVSEALPTLADATGDTDGVPNSWIEQQGITRDQAADKALDNSGMTVANKWRAGLNVADGETYEIKEMAMSGAAGAVKATLTVPAMNPPAGYKNVIVYGSDPENLTTQADITAGASTVTIDVTKESSGVTKFYYRLKSVENTAEQQ